MGRKFVCEDFLVTLLMVVGYDFDMISAVYKQVLSSRDYANLDDDDQVAVAGPPVKKNGGSGTTLALQLTMSSGMQRQPVRSAWANGRPGPR